MKVLLDENLDPRFRTLLSEHDCVTASYAGWDGLKNGALLAVAETAGFEVFLTGGYEDSRRAEYGWSDDCYRGDDRSSVVHCARSHNDDCRCSCLSQAWNDRGRGVREVSAVVAQDRYNFYAACVKSDMMSKIENLFAASAVPLGLGISGSIYAVWSIVALKPYKRTVLQGIWSLGGLFFLLLSIALSVTLLAVILPKPLSDTASRYYLSIGEGLAVLAILCAFQIDDLAPRSWLRACAVLVAFSWLPFIFFYQTFFGH